MGNDSSKSGGLHFGKANSAVTQKYLETAKKTRVLQLRSCNLKEVPEFITEVAPLIRTVDVSTNKLKIIPDFVGQFAALKQLNLSRNLLISLPDDLGNLKNLEVLNVSFNQISALPDTLVGCRALETVNISNNAFQSFPVVLCHLPFVVTIDATKNKITELPDEIGDVHASDLILNQNALTSLNPNIVKAKRLKTLRVEYNALQKQAFTEDLLRNGQITLIAMTGNKFQERDFQSLPGYDAYEERFTATRRKGVY